MHHGARARSRATLTIACGLVLLCTTSCRRKDYRQRADNETYRILGEETGGTPWETPVEFTIDVDQRSRLHDPSDPDFPELPHPGPFLHAYRLPELRSAQLAGGQASVDVNALSETEEAGEFLPVQPIPETYWASTPASCLQRMFEFESVRAEYRARYEAEPGDELRDHSERLTLDDIIDLALLNSREYQTQKEQLYRAALRLTEDRFDYAPKFTPGGTGTDADWRHTRVDGSTTESSTFSSAAEMDQMLSTGGRLLARIANEVVLTFDGPEGFTKDVGSEMLFSLSQSVFQRDIQLNPLIQAERELVYAARSFTRFRKTFFVQLASQYYGLLQNYRSIEIDSQNYFSLIRTFEQARAELRAGVQQNAPTPVEVDQFEQEMLSGRSSLISTCNSLEDGLDRLKIAIGLPVETPVNLDLGELERLTLRDQVEVAAERARRWLGRVLYRRNQTTPDRAELLNADRFLIERLLEWSRLRRALNDEDGGAELPDSGATELLLRVLRVDQAHVLVDEVRADLERARADVERAPVILEFQRTSDVIEALLELTSQQRALAAARGADAGAVDAAAQRRAALADRLDALRDRLPDILQNIEQATLDALLADAQQLAQELDVLAAELFQLAGETVESDEEKAQRLNDVTDGLIATAREWLREAGPGLPPLSIDVDDAMATALVQRLDLMNERGRLADDRRNVKITADELKSVLNLNASQSISTRDNKPFAFTKDNSATRLSLTFDLPLNRLSQRNAYRQALIDFQAGRRSLMELEDTIKLDVRTGLRGLDETRIQYPISVTQAALSAEQVLSVRLQLSLGVEGVRGTDLLDALRSSRQSLIAVANRRIGYIVDRALFVLDLELMHLDTFGVWPEISDPDYRPQPDLVYPENAGPTYGRIPRGLLVSEEFRAIERAPLPGAQPATEIAAEHVEESAAGNEDS